MMPESAVSSPTAVTRTRRLPPAATVPPTTTAPDALEISRDSPVIRDSSTSAVPSNTIPSAGTRDPGRTRTTSATRNCARGTLSMPDSVTRSALSGSNAASVSSAPWAWVTAFISSQCPRSMTLINVASSHQTSTSKTPKVAASEAENATTTARLIRVIMPGWRPESSRHAP